MVLGVPILKHFRVTSISYFSTRLAVITKSKEVKPWLVHLYKGENLLAKACGISTNYGIISIFHAYMVWIEKSVTRVTDRYHVACRVMPNSDPE